MTPQAVTLKAFGEYQQARFRREEAQKWLSHVGARGRGSDILRISPAHCSIKIIIAGQYETSGTNYWDSPEKFNPALINAICKHWKLISETALGFMVAAEDEALIASEDEVASAAAAIEAAKVRAHTPTLSPVEA